MGLELSRFAEKQFERLKTAIEKYYLIDAR